MSAQNYKDSAWSDIESAKEYVSSAWQDKEAMHAYNNNAWEEKWSSGIPAVAFDNTIESGVGYVSDGGKSYRIEKDESCKTGGDLRLCIEGNFTNPVISFDWEGGQIYRPTSSASLRTASAGTVYITGYDGTEYTDQNGVSVKPVSTEEFGNGTISGALSGSYDRVGVYIENVAGYKGAYTNLLIQISNLTVDGKKVRFVPDNEFSY